MKLVIIESPFSGNVSRNLKYARLCLADCLERGEAPFASHLLYTQSTVLDDNNPAERMLGINAGFAWAKNAELTAVYEDFGISNGMKLGVQNAIDCKREIDYRTILKFDDKEQKIEELAKHAFYNINEITTSALCACYYCRKTFESRDIIKWVDEGKTALCPFCKIDSVYGDKSGFSMSPKFLELAFKWWFDGSSETF